MNELILTFFYSGKAKKAPGTFGSLASLIFWFVIAKIFFNQEISLQTQNIFWGIFLLVIFIYGWLAIPFYAKKFKTIDHGSIVLDEVVGQVFALQFTFNLIYENYFLQNNLIFWHLILSFAFFRFLDIKKPLFIGWCDRNLKNGFGVMFDDLLCGIVIAGLALIFYFLA